MRRIFVICFVALGCLLVAANGGLAQTPAPRTKAAPRTKVKATPHKAPSKAAPRNAARRAPARQAPKARTSTRKPAVRGPQVRPTTGMATFKDLKAQFSRANKLYSEGNYGKAALIFRGLSVHAGWQQFAVYYNLGNSYFRLQHYGKALAYFRKAQRLQPNNTDLLHNIQLLYKRVGKGEQDVPQLRIKSLFWYYLLNLKQLFFVVIALTYLLLLLLALYIRRRAKDAENVGVLRWSLAGLSAVGLVLWISLGIKVYREEVRQVGVVTKERISARSGYGSHFEPLFWLSEADEVLIKERVEVKGRDGKKRIWLRVEIRLLDKKQKRRIQRRGWIPGSALERV